MAEPPATDPAARPFVVPCADLDTGAPWRWLRAGWRDLRRAPALSLLFGAVIVLVSAGISWLAYALGRFALLATLLSGFVFVAPLICVGLYCVSRALEQGRTPRLRDSFVLARRVLGQAGVFALGQGGEVDPPVGPVRTDAGVAELAVALARDQQRIRVRVA